MIAGILAQFRAYPVAATLEYGSVCVCVVLFVGTIALLSTGPPRGTATPWLALIGLGTAFVLFWTALVPIYDRLR